MAANSNSHGSPRMEGLDVYRAMRRILQIDRGCDKQNSTELQPWCKGALEGT